MKPYIKETAQQFIKTACWAEDALPEQDVIITLKAAYDICNTFYDNVLNDDNRLNGSLEEEFKSLSNDDIGHNLWLTALGHGAGFWDRDNISQPLRDLLTEHARSLEHDCQLFQSEYFISNDEDD